MEKSNKIINLELEVLNEVDKFAKKYFTSTNEKVDIRKMLLDNYHPVFVNYNDEIYYVERPTENSTQVTIFDKIMREVNCEKYMGYLYQDLHNYYKFSPQSKSISYEEFLVDYIASLEIQKNF